MVPLGQLLPFVLVSVLIVVVPGPDFVLITRNTLVGGRAAGLATAAGVSLGVTGYAVLAVAGLAALIASSGTALLVLRLIGAAYLVYLGTSGLVRLWRGWRRGTREPAAEPRPSRRGGTPFLQGLLNNALNPKALGFFITLLPQFVTPGPGASAQTALLGAIVAGVTVAWWLLYVVAITRLSDLLHRRRVRRGIELTSGVALTAFGVALALAA